MISKHSSIAILGGGAWGLSTAFHLTKAGHSDITVYERAEAIPSPYSAAFDLNKIVRAEYEDPFYTELALEAMKAWKTRLFGAHYHQTGYVVATTGRAPAKAVEHLEKALKSIESDPALAGGINRLDGAEDFKFYTWQYSGPLTGFKGYYNRTAGYAHSSHALKTLWEHCASHGVKFKLGEEAGKVIDLVRSGAKVTSIKTADGKTHATDLVICALGAHGASLIPALGKFVVARSWSVAHVQLTQEESDFLRGIPTTNVRDLGFFFEPDPETRLFKLCPLGIGYTNTDQDGISLPPTDRLPPPQNFIPAEDEKKLRQLLRETFPWMADRPFVEQRLCWFADTKDSDFYIDYVPNTDKSVICLSGDSGHGFKMMPIFGKWVEHLIRAGEQPEPRWQWRAPADSSAMWGDSVSWRIGKGAELKELVQAHSRVIRAKL
nr:l-saccharopine oxidase [Quercus suber]